MLFNLLRRYGLHLLLFCLTLVTTTLAGAEWMHAKIFWFNELGEFRFTGWMSREEVLAGLYFSLPFLGVLTVHEFGHYLTAKYYRVRVTLPYYIPFWLGIGSTIGTMGAFIRIKDRIFSRKEFFDIGIAGPLAGFAVALPLLFYAFTHLPPPESIFKIHPEYMAYGRYYADYVYQDNPAASFALGKNLLFLFFEHFVAPDPALVPNQYELMHYPLLFAGYLALFFTALNLLPIGQLDGGHILYGLIGYRQFNRFSPVLFVLLILYAGTGIITPETSPDELQWSLPVYLLYLFVVFQRVMPNPRLTLLLALGVLTVQYGITYFFPETSGYSGWLAFGFLLGRILGVYHPPCPDERPLSTGRKWLGWLSLAIFILCFSPTPFIIK